MDTIMGSTDSGANGLLGLDSNSLLHIASFLTSSRDLASLQLSCRTMATLLQHSGAWAQVLQHEYGLALQVSKTCVDMVQVG